MATAKTTKPRPRAKAKHDAANDVTHSDGYTSLIKGLGIRGRDPAQHEFATMPNVDDEQLESCFRGDGVGARLVELLPHESLRQGWGVRVDEMAGAEGEPTTPAKPKPKPKLTTKPKAKPPSGEGGEDVDPEEANAINDQMQAYARKLKFPERFREAAVLGPLFGGALRRARGRSELRGLRRAQVL